MINPTTDAVVANLPVGTSPVGVAVSTTGPDAGDVFVVQSVSGTVPVINPTNNTEIQSISIGGLLHAVAVSPNGSQVFVTNEFNGSVSVINTATNTVTGSRIPVGSDPSGVAVNSTGSEVFVTNEFNGTVSVINTATDTVAATITVGDVPMAVAAD